ncbi:MAG: phosphoribosylglycinamide synthetase C domain-containing protein [Planctomycetota bacterium]
MLVAKGQLHTLPQLEFSERAAVCVVMASQGYPEQPVTGRPILGLDEAAALPDVEIYHAGTAQHSGQLVTSGGRVLGVTGLGVSVAEARRRAYDAVQRIPSRGCSSAATSAPVCGGFSERASWRQRSRSSCRSSMRRGRCAIISCACTLSTVTRRSSSSMAAARMRPWRLPGSTRA